MAEVLEKDEVKEGEIDVSQAWESEVPKVSPTPRKRGRPRKIDLMTPAEQIALHVQRNTYSVQMASKEVKKDIYSDERIIVEPGEEQYLETDASAKREEWLELVASAQEDRILKGKIISVTEVDTMNGSYPEYLVKVQFKTGKFEVKIPSYTLYQYYYPDMNEAMAESIHQNLIRRIGSEIEFVVRYVDEKRGIAFADRLAALSMRGVANYTSIKGRKPKVMVGDLVQAKIVAIARTYITVEAAGAEIQIPIEECSWLYVADARTFDGINTTEDYRVGSRVVVKILSAEPEKVKVFNTSYTLIKATASIKQAKANPRIKYFEEFKPKDIYAGKITGITESGVYVVLDNKLDVLCKFPTSGRMPIIGDSAVVEINSKDEEKKFLYGKLI